MPHCVKVDGECKDKVFSEYENNKKKIIDDGLDKDLLFNIKLNDSEKKWGSVSEEYKTMKRADFCKNIPLTENGNGFALYTKGPCLVPTCKEHLQKVKLLCDKKDATSNEFVDAFDSYQKKETIPDESSSVHDIDSSEVDGIDSEVDDDSSKVDGNDSEMV